MKNRGAIRLIAIVPAPVCIYKLSFTWVTKKVERQAVRIAQGDAKKEYHYLDSISNERFTTSCG